MPALLRALSALCALGAAVNAAPDRFYVLTSADVASITADIVATFALNDQFGQGCAPCTAGDNIGAMVRLIFHDACGGGGALGLGGANGCIDFDTLDNKGLEDVVAAYDTIFARWSSKISRADLWVLGANVAIKHASTVPAPGSRAFLKPYPTALQRPPFTLNLPFRYGRVDDAACDKKDEGLLPPKNFRFSESIKLFGSRVGMTPVEVTAIFGAHTLGRCEFKNSGVEGGWSTLQSSFSNFYYRTLGRVQWNLLNRTVGVAVDTGGTTSEGVWQDPITKAIMLPADVETVYSPALPTSNPAQAGCPVFVNFVQPNCVRSTAYGNPYQFVVEWADVDQTLVPSGTERWYRNFTTAYQKMTEFTWEGQLANVGTALPAACTSCALGSYSPTGCVPCLPMTCFIGWGPTKAYGAKAATECALCTAGAYSPGGAAACLPTACSPGSSSPAGASSPTAQCAVCGLGYYSMGGSGQCTATSCAIGYAAPLAASSQTDNCTQCVAGKYSAGGSAPCSNVVCSPGWGGWVGATTSTSCTRCLAGSWSAGGAGASVCVATVCPWGYWSLAGATTISGNCSTSCGDGMRAGFENCDDGNLIAGDGCNAFCRIETGFGCNGTSPTQCNACAAGYYSVGNYVLGTAGSSLACSPLACPPGYASATVRATSASTISCTQCAAGRYGAGGAAQCAPTTCSPGFSSPAGASSPSAQCTTKCGDALRAGAETCDDGNVVSKDGCSSACVLEAGFLCAGGTPTSKDTCTNSTAAAACGNGMRAGAESCDDGNTVGGDGCGSNCAVEPGWECSGGSAAGNDACFKCASSLWSPGGSTALCQSQACPSGSVTGTATGVSIADGDCAPCGATLYATGNACAQMACPAGSATTVASGATAADQGCVACAAGTYSRGGAVKDCSPMSCSAGFGSSKVGSASALDGCTQCVAGKYSAGSASCAPATCNPGSASSAGASTASGSCNTCAPGSYSAGGASSSCAPTSCPPGTASPAAAASATLQCVACPAGTYSPGGARLCAPTICAPGFTSPSGASSVSAQCVSACGDGALALTEACDDGNAISGDGCDSRCLLEVGWYCPASAPGARSACALAPRTDLPAAAGGTAYVRGQLTLKSAGLAAALFDVTAQGMLRAAVAAAILAAPGPAVAPSDVVFEGVSDLLSAGARLLTQGGEGGAAAAGGGHPADCPHLAAQMRGAPAAARPAGHPDTGRLLASSVVGVSVDVRVVVPVTQAVSAAAAFKTALSTGAPVIASTMSLYFPLAAVSLAPNTVVSYVDGTGAGSAGSGVAAPGSSGTSGGSSLITGGVVGGILCAACIVAALVVAHRRGAIALPFLASSRGRKHVDDHIMTPPPAAAVSTQSVHVEMREGKPVVVPRVVAVNTSTAPQALRAGWSEANDPQTGEVYYFDESGNTSWERPI